MGKGSIIAGVVVLVVIVLGGLIFWSQFLAVEDIADIKDDENVGEIVTVRGEVKNTVKIGTLSGYTLEDDTGSIAVASEELPAEGDSVRVSGELKKAFLIGYYIDVDYDKE